MTHSHDTATPALSVEREYVLVPREPSDRMTAIGQKHRYDSAWSIGAIYRAMIDAAPAPNPSPAAKGGEAVVVPYDDFHAAYGFVPRSKVSPDRCLKTRLRALLCAEDLAHADEAEALATSSPQPADAVREAGRTLDDRLTEYAIGIECEEDAREFDGHVAPALSRFRAALASDPAPAGEAVEAVGRELDRQRKRADHNADLYWVMRERAEAAEAALAATQTPTHSDDLAVDRFAAAMKSKLANKRKEGRGGWDDPVRCSAAILSRLLHEHVEKGDPLDVGNLAMMLHQRGESIIDPAPEDTARLREELERESKESYEIGKRDGYEKAVQHIDERTGGDGVYCYCMGFDEDDRNCPDPQSMIARIVGRFDTLSEQTNIANRDRDDARKALEAVRDILDYSIDYHHQGMGCGLEDRNVTDRYEAMRYGWDEALDRFHDEVIKFAIEEIDAALATEASR